MKALCLFLILTATSGAQAGGRLKNVDLSLCLNESSRCLRLLADQGKSTELKALFVLSSPQVTWTEINGSKTEKKFSSGYIDFETELLVLRESGAKNGEEILANLKTLEQTRVVTK